VLRAFDALHRKKQTGLSCAFFFPFLCVFPHFLSSPPN
jgi:hypothetical protein